MVDLSKFPGSSCWFSRDFEAGRQVPSEDGIHEAPDSVDKNSIKDVVGVEQKMRVDGRDVLFLEFRSYSIRTPELRFLLLRDTRA